MENARKNRGRQRERCFIVLLLGCVFFIMFINYRILYPMYIYNCDDWLYIIPWRNLLPEWGAWNPSRVLPETLMPLVAQLSMWIFYPIMHDFLETLAFGMALTMSVFVTIYVFCFYRLIKKKRNVSTLMAGFLSVLFLVLHFVAMRIFPSGNDHFLGGCYDTTTYFFYTIPGLWNASLVMHMMTENYLIDRKEKKLYHRALVLTAIYFAILSNLYQNIILIGYVFADAFIQMVKAKNNKSRFAWKMIIPHLLILAFWLVALLFETSGRRAASLTKANSLSLFEKIGTTFSGLYVRLRTLNVPFLCLLFGTTILLFSAVVKKNCSFRRAFWL